MYILGMNTTHVFAERIKELRQEKNLSLKQLGEEIGVSSIAISRWENEKRVPSIETLVKLATYFKVSTDYLLGLEN